MNRLFRELFICRSAVCLALWCLSLAGQAETFRVATYNVDNYLDGTSKGRRTKTVEARRKVAEVLLSARPDVVALQEMGGDGELKELQDSLRAGGLDLPHRELVFAADTNIHVAVLSRFPVMASRPQTNVSFLLSGRRFKVGRGFGEFDIQVTSNYSFTLITAHLKSRRLALVADQAEQRVEEAKLLRRRIDAQFEGNPEVNLVVLGDLNDVPESRSTRLVTGKRRNALIDTCPAALQEGEAPDVPQAAQASQAKPAWTYLYLKENSRLRIDYLLLSAGMVREWVTNETCVWNCPDWDLASDHRPVIATFEAKDR